MAYPISTIVDARNDSDLTFEFEINHNSNARSDTVEGSGKFLKGLVYTRKGHSKKQGIMYFHKTMNQIQGQIEKFSTRPHLT